MLSLNQNVGFSFSLAPLRGQPSDGLFEVAAEFSDKAHKLCLFSFLGCVDQIFLVANLGGVHGRVCAAEAYPHLAVGCVGAVGLVDGEYLVLLLVAEPEQFLYVGELV